MVTHNVSRNSVHEVHILFETFVRVKGAGRWMGKLDGEGRGVVGEGGGGGGRGSYVNPTWFVPQV